MPQGTIVSAVTWHGFACSVRGASHIAQGTPNQDAGGFRLLPDRAGAVLAVADGHGDKAHARSDRGSRFAVEVALNVIEQWVIAAGDNAPSVLTRAASEVKRRVLSSWQAAVDADLAAFPPHRQGETKEDSDAAQSKDRRLLYGTTLLVAALTPTYAFYLQIGDGDLLAVEQDGSVRKVLTKDPDLPLNQSDSLCQHDAVKRMTTTVEIFDEVAPPALVLLSSDGYANSYPSEDAFVQIGRDLQGYLSNRGFAWTCERVEGWLAQTSAAGSGDDITLAFAWNGDEGAAGADDHSSPSMADHRKTAVMAAHRRMAATAAHIRHGPAQAGKRRALATVVAIVALVGMLIALAGVGLRVWQTPDTIENEVAAETADLDSEAAIPAIDEQENKE